MKCWVKTCMAIGIIIAIFISFEVGKIQGVSFDPLSRMASETSRRVVNLRKEHWVEAPEYFSPDSWINDVDSKTFFESYKRKTHIRIKAISFMDIVFCMVFLPILAFMIIIRLFGRCLFHLWNVIIYIHKSDGEEDYLLLRCFGT